MTDDVPTAQAWPPDRFFWTLLDAPGLRRAGLLPQGLWAELQEDLPVPIEDIHAVCVPVAADEPEPGTSPEGRLMVCAAPRRLLAEVDPTLVALYPASLPNILGVGAECRQLNLLVGEFEPRSIRRAREHRHLVAVAATLLGAALVTVGYLRRTEHWRLVADGAREAGAQVLALVTPGGGSETIRAELARLRPATEAAANVGLPPDAASGLAALLDAWPMDVPSKPQSISVSPSGAIVSVAIDGDAAPFLHAFSPPAGWRLEEPRLNTAGTITRVTLKLHRSPATKGNSP